jgi:ketosteroid isomerase-like protein
VTPEDRVAIGELMALYGHVIDERQWSRIGELFTDDVLYDVSDMELGHIRGIDAVLEFWTDAGTHHPIAHHATNVVVDEEPDGSARVTSKAVCVGKSGRAMSFTYRDVVRRGEDGRWRMAERIITLRRPEAGTAPLSEPTSVER